MTQAVVPVPTLYLVDTNILLRSAEPAHPQYPTATGAVAALLRAGEELFIVPQNLYEFWTVATRPAVQRGGLGMTAEEAQREIAALQTDFTLLLDTPALYGEWLRLVVDNAVLGVQAHDARLVAAMQVHGLTHILTINVRDFTGFPGITVVD